MVEMLHHIAGIFNQKNLKHWVQVLTDKLLGSVKPEHIEPAVQCKKINFILTLDKESTFVLQVECSVSVVQMMHFKTILILLYFHETI